LYAGGRFYTLGRGNFSKWLSYALSRALITKEDSGGETFNASEIVGTGAAAGISLLYYPAQYRTWTRTEQRWLTNVLLDSSTFVVRELWPDINRTIFRRKNSSPRIHPYSGNSSNGKQCPETGSSFSQLFSAETCLAVHGFGLSTTIATPFHVE
jgi:hypothetical protein